MLKMEEVANKFMQKIRESNPKMYEQLEGNTKDKSTQELRLALSLHTVTAGPNPSIDDKMMQAVLVYEILRREDDVAKEFRKMLEFAEAQAAEYIKKFGPCDCPACTAERAKEKMH